MDTMVKQFPKGILHPQVGETKYSLRRFPPSPDVGSFVQHYWVVQWDLRGQAPYHQTVLSHPNVNLVFEHNLTRIYGVSTTTSTRLIEDHGWVVGVKFKPGGFYPFWHAPVSQLTGNSVSFQRVFGMNSSSLEKEILDQRNVELGVSKVESFLKSQLPDPDQNVEFVSDIVFEIREDRSIVKVEDVVRLAGLHKRTVQRLFDRYVGVSPKWVILRYRLHEALARLDQDDVSDWTELALELGYYDHSHFIRDFKSIVGTTPEEYVYGR